MPLQPINPLIGVIFFGTLVAISITLPVTLNVKGLNQTVAPTPPGGNELSVPAGAVALGIADQFTQRICPFRNASIRLPTRATNERTLSNQFFAQTGPKEEPRGLTAFAVFFGQFLDHELILSLSDPGLAGDTIEMLPNTGVFLDLDRVQRRIAPDTGLTETFNQLSGHIDGTTIYGDYRRPALIEQLRESKDSVLQCRLKEGPNRTPLYQGGTFLCGDERCAETLPLTAIHALFLREHNRRCDELGTLYPGWTEEERFWQARAMTVAILQHITYTEWLPTLFGTQHTLIGTQVGGGSVQTKGEYTRISTEFGSAAFRFGHSMVPETIGDLVIRDLFFNPNLTISIGPDAILRKTIDQPAQRLDNEVVDSLRNFLFTTQHFTVSEDLVVRNLYRAREIDMASYEDLCACFGTTPTTFPEEGVPTDPIRGLLSEPLVPGSSLPPTLARIVAEQFKRLRDNDERFYTKGPQATGLTFTDIQEITRTTMRQVLLRNTNLTEEDVPMNPYKAP